MTEQDSLVSTVQGIVGLEKFKKRIKDEEIKKISDRNALYEEEIKKKIRRLTEEIKGLKEFIRDTTEKLEIKKIEFEAFKKKYEEDSNNLSFLEAQELLSKDKGKKVIKPGEEKDYFIKKEKLRQIKQELHKNYQEKKERFEEFFENTSKTLESSSYQRQISKKELKEHREELVMLYCRTLKDGKYIKSDGLR